jgi:hypothetical protein
MRSFGKVGELATRSIGSDEERSTYVLEIIDIDISPDDHSHMKTFGRIQVSINMRDKAVYF